MRHSLQKKDVSIDHAFSITMLFFEDLFTLLAPGLNLAEEDYEIVLLEGLEYPLAWEDAVFHVTNIPKFQQKEMNIPIELLFPIVIAFVRKFFKRYTRK